MTQINEPEKIVLEYLATWTEESGGMCLSFRPIIEDTGLDRKTVRKCCRSLKRKGLTDFYRGLMNDDNNVAGAGYCITREGINLIDNLSAGNPD